MARIVLEQLEDYLQGISERRFLNKAVFLAIGEALLQSTDKRFDTQQAPDGTPWAPLNEQYLAYKRKFNYGDKILKLRGHLRDTLTMQANSTSVAIGSNRNYSGIHQYGGINRYGHYTPARPYLGINEKDKEEIIDILQAAYDAMQP